MSLRHQGFSSFAADAGDASTFAQIRGEWLPFAWPRDGRRETLEGAGVALAKQYAVHVLNMLSGHARFPDGSVSVEAGLMEMLDRMQSGRFKVFSSLHSWFEEFRLTCQVDWLLCRRGNGSPLNIPHEPRRDPSAIKLQPNLPPAPPNRPPSPAGRRCAPLKTAWAGNSQWYTSFLSPLASTGSMPPIRVQYPGSSPVDEAVEQLGDEWQAVAERYV